MSFPLFSQSAIDWKNYTDMKNVKSLVLDGDIIWGATNGGVFSFNLSDNTYITYSKTDGLNGILIISAAIDKYGKVWFGSKNGVIDVFDPQTKSFTTILDIFIYDKNPKSINEIVASGDTIFISSDFGISLINATNYFFIDTFFKYGDFPSYIRINSISKYNVIYTCTERGIAIQKPGTINLSAPESWTVYRIANGLPSDSTIKIISYRDTVITATSKGLSYFNDTSWLTYLSQFNGFRINDINIAGDSLFILAENKNLFRYYNGELTMVYSSPVNNLNNFYYSIQTGFLISTTNGILKLNDGSEIYPNGPAANQFPDMAVNNNGVLWSASGSDVSGVGFYGYNGSEWTNYNRANYPELPANSYFSVYTTTDNKICLGSWGSGFTIINNGQFTNYNRQNTGIQGIPNAPDFIVTSGFAEDSKNNLWVLNYWAADRKVLSSSSDLQEWTSFLVPATGNAPLEEVFNLAIDPYNTKWFCARRGRVGLFYFNEGNNVESSSDDVSGYLTESSGLNNSAIFSIAVDRRGDVWVGTSLGVNIISNVNSVLSGNPQLRITSIFSLRQQTITAIAVDPLNQKWIGTNQGLTLVNSDGTSLLATFTTKNSALLSDEIKSIAIDENSGTIYVGTDNGLTSFKTTSVKPNESFDELFVYPNPLILNKNDNNIITIEGLIRDTDIKILTINGKLIREFSSPGGRVALWDGRDEFGEFVSSGIYFVVAFDKEGNNVSTSKLAILRED